MILEDFLQFLFSIRPIPRQFKGPLRFAVTLTLDVNYHVFIAIQKCSFLSRDRYFYHLGTRVKDLKAGYRSNFLDNLST